MKLALSASVVAGVESDAVVDTGAVAREGVDDVGDVNDVGDVDEVGDVDDVEAHELINTATPATASPHLRMRLIAR
jgi:hypothetical protein